MTMERSILHAPLNPLDGQRLHMVRKSSTPDCNRRVEDLFMS